MLARITPKGTIVSFGSSSREPTCFDVSGLYGRPPERASTPS